MGAVADVRSFASAVKQRWIGVATVSGVALVIGIVEHIREKSVSWAVYVTLLALGLLFASFRAWGDERHRADERERELGIERAEDATLRTSLRDEQKRAGELERDLGIAESKLDSL